MVLMRLYLLLISINEIPVFAKYTVTVFTLGMTKLGRCCTVYTATKQKS